MAETATPFESPEQPIYLLAQKKSRALLPKIVSSIILGAIFYLGILLNVALLELRAKTETNVKLVALISIILIIIIGLVLAERQAALKFRFYQNRLAFNKKEILYLQINNTTPQQNFLDKIFHTYHLDLGHKFFLRHIPQEVQLESYLQQLKDYAQQISSHSENHKNT